MSTKLKLKILTLTAFLIIAVLGVFSWLSYTANSKKVFNSSQLAYIPAGTSIDGIYEELSALGIIDVISPEIFKVIYVLYGEGLPMRAGEFAFEGEISAVDVIRHLQTGYMHYRRVTIPEGYSTLQALETVMSAEKLEGEIATDIAEGTLLPDTYYYSYGDYRMDVVDRMMSARNDLVAGIWSKRDKGIDDVIATPEQAVILASIVEKETGMFDERAKIAGVFINRLRAGMKLQSDPTTIYSLTRGVQILGRKLSSKDLAFESPYNTYHIKGLPPTPICNPGRESIEAVMHPSMSKNLYFVSNNQGGHYFAETLKQHHANVKKYREHRP